MADSKSKEIQVRQKQEVSGPAEMTRPGTVFTPDVDIFETDTEITLVADMPGVEKEDITIDLRENVLTIAAEAKEQIEAGEAPVITEYETGKYFRQFTLSEVIDQEKIDAKLTNGVLNLKLPKVEKATPKKIEVSAA